MLPVPIPAVLAGWGRWVKRRETVSRDGWRDVVKVQNLARSIIVISILGIEGNLKIVDHYHGGATEIEYDVQLFGERQIVVPMSV